MKRNTLIALAVFGLLLVVGLLSLTRTQERGISRLSFAEVTADTIDKVEMTGKHTVSLYKDGETWRIKREKGDKQADGNAVTRLVESIPKVVSSELVTRTVGKFADLEDRTLRRKMARQAARSVLPNATETKIFVTANARALRHFIELRCNEHAETEIRMVAAQVLDILRKDAPNIFGDYEFIDLPDGTRAAKTPHVKV